MSQEEQAVPPQEIVQDEGISPTPPVQSEEPIQSEEQTGEALPPEIENAKQRTRDRFQKLTGDLKDSNNKLERKSVFEDFQPAQQQVVQPPQQVDLNQFIQPDGSMDVNGANFAINQAVTVGQMGYQQSQQAFAYMRKMDERIQEQEAYGKHESLNPQSDAFDPDLRDLVAAKLLKNMVDAQRNPALKVMTLAEAADSVTRNYAKMQTPTKIAKQAVEEYKVAQEARQQGPLTQGSGERETVNDIQQLKQLSIKGSKEQRDAALAARIKALQ